MYKLTNKTVDTENVVIPSPKNKNLILYQDEFSITIQDIESEEIIKKLEFGVEIINIRFTSDGEHLLIFDCVGKIHLINTESYKIDIINIDSHCYHITNDSIYYAVAIEDSENNYIKKYNFITKEYAEDYVTDGFLRFTSFNDSILILEGLDGKTLFDLINKKDLEEIDDGILGKTINNKYYQVENEACELVEYELDSENKLIRKVIYTSPNFIVNFDINGDNICIVDTENIFTQNLKTGCVNIIDNVEFTNTDMDDFLNDGTILAKVNFVMDGEYLIYSKFVSNEDDDEDEEIFMTYIYLEDKLHTGEK